MADYNYSQLDEQTQLKIFKAVEAQMLSIKLSNPTQPLAMLMAVIQEEAYDAIMEKAEDCPKCGCQAANMEWQDFDRIFICPDCGAEQ